MVEKTLPLDADSRYSWTFKPRKAGVYIVSVEYTGDSVHLGNTSPVKSFRVVDR